MTCKNTPQLEVIILGCQRNFVFAIGEQSHGAVEVTHVREAVQNEQYAHRSGVSALAVVIPGFAGTITRR